MYVYIYTYIHIYIYIYIHTHTYTYIDTHVRFVPTSLGPGRREALRPGSGGSSGQADVGKVYSV